MLAGVLGARLGTNQAGWTATLLLTAGIFAVAATYNALLMPRPVADKPQEVADAAANSWDILRTFFAKEGIVVGLLFIVFFRFAENHIAKLVSPFLLDPIVDGGLGLSLETVGVVKGTFGVASLVIGGILGGVAIYSGGLKKWLWPMVVMLNLPNLVYWWLARTQPESLDIITGLICVEQFGYGFGFSAYMMYLIKLADGPHKTAHYAFATGLMALAVWAASFWSGAMQESLGYEQFFLWATATAIPAFVVVALVDVPPEFGKRKVK